MVTVTWGHLCDYAFFDESKKPCVIGIFSNIFAMRVPTSHPKCAFIFELKGEKNEEVKIRIELVRPDGRDPLIDFRNDKLSLTQSGIITNNVVLENLPLPDYGPYEIRIYVNDKISHTTVFTVMRPPVKKGV